MHSCSLGSVSLPPLSWGCGVVLGMLAGRGAEMGALGNEAVSALGSWSSPESDSSPEMCQERVRRETSLNLLFVSSARRVLVVY